MKGRDERAPPASALVDKTTPSLCRFLCRFLGRRVASVEMGAALPASEKRQGTKSRVRCAGGSGWPMGNWRRWEG